MIKHSIFSSIDNEKIVAYAMSHIDYKVEFQEEQLRINDQQTIEIIGYALAYLEDRITFHEEFINSYEGKKTDLAVQLNLIPRYKQELKELTVLSEDLMKSNKIEKTKVIESYRDLIDELSGQTLEELNSNYNLNSLKKTASAFNLPGRSKMNKIKLCLNIEQYLNDLSIFVTEQNGRRTMSENDLHDFVKELQGSSMELYNFVAENSENLTEEKIDDLVEDLKGDYLSLREFVINANEE